MPRRHRSLQPADVRAFSVSSALPGSDQKTFGAPTGRVIDRQIGHTELGEHRRDVRILFVLRRVTRADVEGHRKRVIPDVRGVVTCGAGTGDHRQAQRIVQPSNVGDQQRMGAETCSPRATDRRAGVSLRYS